MPYLEMKGITKLYSNGFLANDAIDFSVEKNEIHAVIGENGAGKTTLMKILYGLEQADAGTITLRGSRVGFTVRLMRIVSGSAWSTSISSSSRTSPSRRTWSWASSRCGRGCL